MPNETNPTLTDTVDSDATTGNAVTTGNASAGSATAAAIETDDATQNADQLPGDGATQTGSMTTDTAALGGGVATVGTPDSEAGPDSDGGSR